MSSLDGQISSNTDPSHRGFSNLHSFLQHAFQQKGLVSIPPEVLQRFKQCPQQDIDCPNIAAFAKLFEGTHSCNRFRLEANSFVYMVQILFHLRPNLVQERILHLLMVSVRLLKDEKEASRRLSDLAGREIDRHAVARKRATISRRLVPWLLKHFSHDSTIVRLKIIAAQFLFHLLQGDEEAKKILSSVPQKERWSLGRAISASPHPPLRILAANIFREISLADIDVRLFWSSDLPDGNGHRVPSSFIADGQWLHSTALYLHGLDDRQAVPPESRTKTYEIQSLTVGPLSFSDNASKALASVSDRLLFIVPAHQHRPLQILEIPLVANMDYVRSDGSVVDDDKPGAKAELRLQLQNTGFYILNGFKSAIDQIHLSFATRDDCGSFCHAMAHSLQNIPNGLLTHALGESHVDSDTGKSRPRKQSHAVMIDLSQDIVISGVSQLMSPPLKEARRVSTSGLIDVSRSTESFTSHSSPPEEIKEQEAVSLQPEGNEEYPLGSRRVQENSHDYNGAELISNADDHEKAKSVHQVRRVSDPDQLRGKPIAPAQSEAIGQEAFEEQTTGAHLPQRAHQPGFVEPNIRSPAANSSLQHLALEALQHSTPNQMTVVSTNTDSVIRSKEGRQNSRAVGSEDGAPRPAQPSSVLAKSARRKGLKPITAKQVASSAMSQIRGQLDQTKSETSKTLLKRPRAANATLYVTTTVDWDEDLRADPNGHEDQSNDTRRPKTGISRSATNRAKKSIGTKFGPKPSSSRRKGRATAKSKENKTQTASVNKGLAATRPRRAAAKVSYDERSQQEEQSQDIERETKDTASQVETEKRPPVALSPHTFSDNTHGKIQLVDDRSLGDAADESRLGELHAPSPPLSRVTVATSGSGEAHLSSVELQKERQNEGFEIDVPGSNSAPFCGGKDKTEVNRESPERTDLPDVEAVDDSHPLDNQQRMDAMKAARRSFGSTLMNVMNESGIQPGKTGSTVAKAKPFGDKAAFVDSVKTALNQSSSRHGTQGPSSDRKKHAQTPSRKKQVSEFTTPGGPASELLHSARMNSQQTTKGSISRPQYDEGFTMATAAQLANAVKPIVAPMPSKSPRTSSPFLQQQRLTTDQTQPIVEIEGSQGDGTHNRPSNPPKSTERMRLSAETIWPSPSVPQTNAAASTLNNERKGGLASDGEEAPQVKRARRSGPSHEKPQVSDQSMSKIVLQAPPTGNTTVGATGNVSGISPRPEREPEEGIQIEAPAGIGIQQTQNPAQTVQRRRGRPRVRSSADALKSAQAKAHTPRRHVGLGPPTLEEDYLHRKAQIVGFSANGSRYQGGVSVGKQGPALAQSGCVPTETGKHLAFKKLHTESKAIQQPQKIVTKRSQLFTHEGKRTVQLSLSDTDDPICVEEGSAENVAPAPAFSYLENSKSASQTSKVDENGSPRLHLRKISQIPFAQKGSSAIEVAREADESVGTSSVYESSDSEVLQTNESAHFGLETAVHNYHTVNSQMTAMMKTARSRPSIGVGELLDRSFPQASNSIKTNAFKAAVLADTTEPLQASQKADSTTLLSHNRSLDRVIISRETIAGPVPVDRDGTPSFDIDRLNISIADERSNSSASARVRRLRSSTPCSSGGGAPRPADSPPSFHTRLGKMIMPPPPRKHMNKMETSNEYETGGCLLGEKSALMDAETTLVNGDASEGETNVASPHKQQGSSSSLSDEGDGGPTSSSPQAADQALHGGRRFWNHKVAETQQTVLEILEQVSEKLLLRFSSAEEGIQFKLDHYHYGGRKILNNFVEQFDKRVTQEKEMPSSRMREHRKHLDETIDRLQQAKCRTRAGPSLDDLEKNRERRSQYVLTNLERFVAAQ